MSTSSSFSAWPFSMPSRALATPQPLASANALASAFATRPTTIGPSIMAPYQPAIAQTNYFLPQTNPYSNYSPWPVNITGSNSVNTLTQPIYYAPSISTYPTNTISNNYMPYITAYNLPMQAFASATASTNAQSNSSNQLLSLLLTQLLSQLKQSQTTNNYYSTTSPIVDLDKADVVQTSNNGTNINNEGKLTNNDVINIIINNFLINPKNVNIAGINTGTQENKSTTDTKEPKYKELPKTHKFPDGIGTLQPDGTYLVPRIKRKGKDGIWKLDPQSGEETVIKKRKSPLVIDLNGNDKIDTTANNRNDIDLDNDGQKDSISQIKDDGMLFIDPNKTGKITSGTQLIGNHTLGNTYDNGFDALKAIAEKTLGNAAIADGKLDENELKKLETKLGLGIEVNGELKKLADVGITELSLGFKDTNIADTFGNEVRQVSTAKRDGQDAQLADIWFLKQ